MKFKIGQKVVVNDTILIPAFQELVRFAATMGWRVPEHLKVYTIRGFTEYRGHAGYVVEEIVNKPYHFPLSGVMELHFDECIFSPVQTTSTEAEKLRRLSDPSKWTDEDHERFLAQPVIIKHKEVA